jgi:hypothetical protein
MCGYKPRHAPLVGSRLRTRSGSLAMLLAKRAGILMSASLLIRSISMYGAALSVAHWIARTAKLTTAAKKYEHRVVVLKCVKRTL